MKEEPFLNAYRRSAEAAGNERERAVTSLAEHLIESGELGPETVTYLLASTLAVEPRALVLDLLRVAARLQLRFRDKGDSWTLELVEPVRGLRPEDDESDEEIIRTPSDLDSAAAVVEFILRSPKRHLREGLGTHRKTGMAYRYKRIAEPGLEKLVRERPQDLELILACVSERTAPLRRQDADELWAWLELDMPYYDEGLL